MWQLKRRDGVLVLYQSGILGSALSALLWGSRNHAVGPLSLATLDLKAYLMKCPPRLIIAETDFPPALAGMIAGKLPQVPLYSVSPDRPVVMGRCDRLEWPLTSKQFVCLLKALGSDPRALEFPPPWALQA